MYTHYRMSHPYFGLYKYKISITYDVKENEATFKDRILNVRQFLTSNWKRNDDFKFSNSWNVYLRDKDVFESLTNAFPDSIQTVYLPAPGYEHLDGRKPRQSRVLWYDKFTYKILLKTVSRTESLEILSWCKNNLRGDCKHSSGYASASFYFMNSMDAVAFKLKYSDKIMETEIADVKKASKELKKRIKQATQEYYDYLEGEGLDDC